MNQEYQYFFVPKIAGDNLSNILPKPYRIVRLPKTFPFRFLTDSFNILPYNSVSELRKSDQNWKEYHKSDPKSAEKICKDDFIIKIKDFVLQPNDIEFNKVSYKLLKHTVFGELKKDIQGIHLISNLNTNILSFEIVKPVDKLGVWKANIEYYSKEKDKVFIKNNSSMFPFHWNPTTYMFEIYYAYKNMVQCKEDEKFFHSRTLTGIQVDFIIKNGELITVYPIHQE